MAASAASASGPKSTWSFSRLGECVATVAATLASNALLWTVPSPGYFLRTKLTVRLLSCGAHSNVRSSAGSAVMLSRWISCSLHLQASEISNHQVSGTSDRKPR
eukprot:3745355-Prymnesium_polylepis.2